MDKHIQSIDNIGVCVTDLARAVNFDERFGFAKAFENDRGCTLAAGAAKRFLFKTRQVHPPLVSHELGFFQNAPGIDHISFLVADVD
jgi:hypothetical protein